MQTYIGWSALPQGSALGLPEAARAEEGAPPTLSVGGKIALHELGPAIGEWPNDNH
jgi:hypothetical protein